MASAITLARQAQIRALTTLRTRATRGLPAQIAEALAIAGLVLARRGAYDEAERSYEVLLATETKLAMARRSDLAELAEALGHPDTANRITAALPDRVKLVTRLRRLPDQLARLAQRYALASTSAEEDAVLRDAVVLMEPLAEAITERAQSPDPQRQSEGENAAQLLAVSMRSAMVRYPGVWQIARHICHPDDPLELVSAVMADEQAMHEPQTLHGHIHTMVREMAEGTDTPPREAAPAPHDAAGLARAALNADSADLYWARRSAELDAEIAGHTAPS